MKELYLARGQIRILLIHKADIVQLYRRQNMKAYLNGGFYREEDLYNFAQQRPENEEELRALLGQYQIRQYSAQKFCAEYFRMLEVICGLCYFYSSLKEQSLLPISEIISKQLLDLKAKQIEMNNLQNSLNNNMIPQTIAEKIELNLPLLLNNNILSFENLLTSNIYYSKNAYIHEYIFNYICNSLAA